MRIYVSGPYTQGDTAINVRKAIEAGTRLLDLGHEPYIPHLTHFWHLVYPHDYGVWLKLDRVWLLQCEAVLRLPGVSSGADGECQLAVFNGITVYLDEEAIPKEDNDGDT